MRRQRQRLALALAALPVLLAPATAAAGTASTRTEFVEDRYDTGTDVSLLYRAGPKEANRLRVEVDALGATLTDRAGIRAGRGCRAVAGSGRREVRCRLRGVENFSGDPDDADLLDGLGVTVLLGDRRDVAVVSGDFPTVAASTVGLYGGPGPDRLQSSAGSNFFVGGSGNDTMIGGTGSDEFLEGRRRNGADTMRGGSSSSPDRDVVNYDGRRGRVVADLAGDRDDGAPGERDRIGADVESLRAGSGSDRLTGNAAANVLNGGGGRFDVIRGGRGRDVLSTDARGGVVRSRDGENDSVSCGHRRTRALADGYDEIEPVEPCSLKRNEPVGLLFDTIAASFEVRDLNEFDDTRGDRGPLIGVSLDATCPSDARARVCSGQARLLGGDGRLLGEKAFDIRRRNGSSNVKLPVSEADRERIRAAGSERATLVVDMSGVPRRRYPLTLIAP